MTSGGRITRGDQLVRLVEAHQVLVAEVTPDAVLHRLVELARDIFDVDHAALVVLDADGSPQHVIDSGLDDAVRTCLAQPRAGSGPPPVLLSTEVAHGGTVYGRLHLLGSRPSPATSDEQELLASLAATAAVAMENSLLHEETRRGQDALLAYGAVGRELLAGAPTDAVLEEISRSLRVLVAARGVMVLVPDPDDPELVEVVADSHGGIASLRGRRLRTQESIARQVMASGRGTIVDDVTARMAQLGGVEDTEVGRVQHLMAVPLAGEAGARGAIFAYRTSRPSFGEADLEIATAFARQAAVALERAEERALRATLALLELRGRIADELNRQVVQSLFSVSLNLQGVSSLERLKPHHDQISATLENLDEAARGIRATVYPFPRSTPRAHRSGRASLTEQVLAALVELRPVLGFEPGLSLAGPLNGIADPPLVSDVLAVVRESLTNTAKYARATRAEVRLVAEDARLEVTIADDGVGLGTATRRSGLANLRHRARERGGELVLEHPPEGGLVLRWGVPLR